MAASPTQTAGSGPTLTDLLALMALGTAGYLYMRSKGTPPSSGTSPTTTPATATAVTLQASATQVQTGQPVTLTATAQFPSGATPAGVVQIVDQTTGTVVITGSAPTVSVQVTHNHAGSHTFIAGWAPQAS